MLQQLLLHILKLLQKSIDYKLNKLCYKKKYRYTVVGSKYIDLSVKMCISESTVYVIQNTSMIMV